MIATKTQLFVALVAAAVVSAQSTTTDSAAEPSTTGIPTCILDCVTAAAASAGCASFADLNCVCTSASFQADAGTCLTTNCTADEVGQALALQAAQCGGASTTGDSTTTTDSTATDTTVTTTPSTTAPSSTRTTTSPSSTRTTTSTAPASSTTGTTSSPASTSNAASGQGQQALGVVGALMAGVLGLVL